MVITHNLPAMNVRRHFSTSAKATRALSEKLSSGYRINRSADDAAGLSVSEKMRRQIRGLNQSVKNIEDGISMIQTAEGALDEVHNMLHRMQELSIQSANDTNADEDRRALDAEVQQLKKEIASVFTNTEFNGKGLFTTTYVTLGQLESNTQNLRVGGRRITTYKVLEKGNVSMDSYDYFSTQWTVKNNAGNYGFSFDITDKASGTVVRSLQGEVTKTDVYAMIEGKADCNVRLNDKKSSNDYINIQLRTTLNGKFSPSSSNLEVTNPTQYKKELEAYEAAWFQSIASSNVYMDRVAYCYCGTVDDPIMKDIIIQTGANSGETTKMEWTCLNLDMIGIQGINVLTHSNAQEAIGSVQEAVKIVSATRSNFGAIQNRLEKCRNNNENYAENLQRAESQIRDADMAEEIMKHSRHDILQQTAQAMLAQANQMNQGVLHLLQ